VKSKHIKIGMVKYSRKLSLQNCWVIPYFKLHSPLADVISFVRTYHRLWNMAIDNGHMASSRNSSHRCI